MNRFRKKQSSPTKQGEAPNLGDIGKDRQSEEQGKLKQGLRPGKPGRSNSDHDPKTRSNDLKVEEMTLRQKEKQRRENNPKMRQCAEAGQAPSVDESGGAIPKARKAASSSPLASSRSSKKRSKVLATPPATSGSELDSNLIQSKSTSGSVSVTQPSKKSSVTNNGKRGNGRGNHPSGKGTSRFSLWRLFCGNPLAEPFLQSPLAAPAQTMASRVWNTNGTKEPGETYQTQSQAFRQEDTNSQEEDLDSCSSLGMTSVGPDGKVIRECPLCLARVTLDQFPRLQNCRHLFCLECLQFYVKIELQEGRVNIKCPQCVEQMHPNDIETLVGDRNSNLLRIYEVLMLRRFLASDPDTRWCPGPDCNYAVIASGCASCPRIDCKRPECGYSFCYHCKAEWHPNQTCDMARASRGSDNGYHRVGLSAGKGARAKGRPSSLTFRQESGLLMSEDKVCPRCGVLIVKMDDGSCNHMTCPVCSAKFCWLCMKEISDLHYLSPSGCTFWGKKPWSRKKKLMWQLGILIGAPVGIALLAGIAVPAIIVGIPVWVGRRLYAKYKSGSKHRRNIAIITGVSAAAVVSPLLAGLAVSIGVPISLAYVYGVVPISLCRSEGCGVSTSSSGVKIDVDEEVPYQPTVKNSQVANPSIGEVSLGASLSLISLSLFLDNEDRESASNMAIAGTSRTVSLASSFNNSNKANAISSHLQQSNGYEQSHQQNRLEVGADVHTWHKKFSNSSECLSDTVSLAKMDGVGVNSIAEFDASTRARAGSIFTTFHDQSKDSQSVTSFGRSGKSGPTADAISLRSVGANPPPSSHQPHHQHRHASHQHPHSQMQHSVEPRSLSSVSNISSDEGLSSQESSKKQPHLDNQLSKNSSLPSTEDTTSERVGFSANIDLTDEESDSMVDRWNSKVLQGLKQPVKLEASGIVLEETPKELAMGQSPCQQVASSDQVKNVTLVSIGGSTEDEVVLLRYRELDEKMSEPPMAQSPEL